jgi:hypothetical protein
MARAGKTIPPGGRPGVCQSKNRDGSPCRAKARPGRPWCFTHDPELARTRADARARAGATTSARLRTRLLPTETPPPDLSTSRSVVRYLEQLVAWVQTGALDVRVGNAVGQIVNVLLRALASVETVERIEAIERAVAGLSGGEAEQVKDELAAVKATTEARA